MNHCMQKIGFWKPKWSYKRKTLFYPVGTGPCDNTPWAWRYCLPLLNAEISDEWSNVCYQYIYVCNLFLYIFNVGAWPGREATICPS